jgi:hypothetical protein
MISKEGDELPVTSGEKKHSEPKAKSKNRDQPTREATTRQACLRSEPDWR